MSVSVTNRARKRNHAHRRPSTPFCNTICQKRTHQPAFPYTRSSNSRTFVDNGGYEKGFRTSSIRYRGKFEAARREFVERGRWDWPRLQKIGLGVDRRSTDVLSRIFD